MNYENKIIGLMVFHQNSNFFVPCYPSVYEPDNNIELKFMDDPEITYSNYEDTKMFLEKLYEDSKEKIKVNPKYKIMDDGLIIGILTNGDQFVLISPYEVYKNDDSLPILEENNYLIKNYSEGDNIENRNYKDMDLLLQTNYKKDEERINTITNIKLESGFYDAFKNTVKNIKKSIK